MSWVLKVPKIAHFYWGLNRLPYLRYLTVKSFLKFNPGWKIILWYPKYASRIVTWRTHELNYRNGWDNWIDKLMELPVEKREIDVSEDGIDPQISVVHKSDFLRFKFLSEYGGIYSDMDIVYFRPVENLEVNAEENREAETFVCISYYGHSNGFFMARPGSDFFTKMTRYSKEDLDPTVFQSNGVESCNRHFPTIETIENAVNIGPEAVYFYDGQNYLKIYSEKELWFDRYSIGCHWYGGSILAGDFLNKTNGGLMDLPNTIIGKLCRISL